MKIIAILENPITIGGAFGQALNAIVQMHRICRDRFEFEVFSTHAENVERLEKLGIRCSRVRISLMDRLLATLANALPRGIQARLKLRTRFERELQRRNCDLAYFLTQSTSPELLQTLNYITTVFDLCHRDAPEFPEVRSFGEFRYRERHFAENLAPAALVITESERLSELVAHRYGIDRERCLAMPLAPSPFLQAGSAASMRDVLGRYRLEEGYFFYPAQFWAHKNHVRILEALVLLKGEGLSRRLVLAGGDMGNLEHVGTLVARHGLQDQVRFLGFVPAEDMRGLYEGSAAVVMPTYFGPTNLPPLEAWATRRPLIYASHLREQAGEAALCVNPDDAGALAEAMKACIRPETAAALVDQGTARLQQIGRQREKAELELADRLLAFAARRRCWE